MKERWDANRKSQDLTDKATKKYEESKPPNKINNSESAAEKEFLDLKQRLSEIELKYEQLKKVSELENELLKLSVRLNGMKNAGFLAKIDLALGHIGQFLSADRANIFELNEENNTFSNTHEWCSPGIQPEIQNFQNIPVNEVPVLLKSLKTRDYVIIPNVNALSKKWHAERKILESQQIQSVLAIPVMIDNNLAGFVALDAVTTQKEFTQFEIKALKTWSKLLAGILNNKRLEAIIEKNRLNYEGIFNAINDFLVVVDLQGKIIHVNSKITDTLGYSGKMLLGKSPVILHPEDRKEEVEKYLHEVLNGKMDSCPVPLVTNAGRQIPVETRLYRGSWDGKAACIFICKDISQLLLSEEKFSKIFYSNPSACTLTDLDTKKIIDVNKAFCDLLGFSKEEAIGKTIVELGVMTEAIIYDLLKDSGVEKRASNKESILFTKTGETKHVIISSEDIYVQDQKYRYTVGIDITKRKLAEVELYKQNQKLNAIISASPDGIGIVSFDGKFKYISEHLATMYGYQAEEIEEYIGKSVLGFFPLSEQKRLMENMNSLIKGEKPSKITEYEVIKKDGSSFFVGVNSTIIKGFDGVPESILFVERDITEIKKMEESLRKSEALFRTVLQSIPNLVWMKDPNGVYLWCNALFADFFGVQITNILGKTDYDNVSRKQADVFRNQDNKVVLEGKPAKFEEIVVVGDKTVYFETIKTPVYDNKGSLIGVLGVAHDITKRKINEKELIESEKRLQELNASKDKFFSIISHDLKTPFNSILGFSHLMIDEINDSEYENVKKYAEIISKSSVQAVELVSNLLEWARLQTGKVNHTPKTFKIERLIHEVVGLLTPAAQIKSISLLPLLPMSLTVFADMSMVAAILRNVVSNAVKFTHPHGKIAISVIEETDRVIVKIKDNGVGMDSEIIEKLFRIDESFSTHGTKNEQGSGLGLVISKEFAQKNGGDLWIESEAGKGTSVYLSLPVGKNETN